MTTSAGRDRAIRVLLANSSQLQSHLLRSAMRRRPEFRFHTCAMHGSDIVDLMNSEAIDVVLLNPAAQQPEDNVLAIIRRIRVAYPEVPIVLLHEHHGNSHLLTDALRAGARGLFSFNEAPFRDLCKCIQRVREGQAWLSNGQVRQLLDAFAVAPSLRVINAKGKSLLTPREEQVVALVAEGLSNREVALELLLSEHTVKKYLFRIFDKLGVSTRVELVLYAVGHGGTVGAERLPSSA
jgi:DNA-binding NarL/FixJ family response regulator